MLWLAKTSQNLFLNQSQQVEFCFFFPYSHYLQVDLGKRKTITAIATQGNAYVEKDSRLKEYYIQYSDDGSNWRDYAYEGQRKARLFLTGVGLGIFFFHITIFISLKNLSFVLCGKSFSLQEGGGSVHVKLILNL